MTFRGIDRAPSETARRNRRTDHTPGSKHLRFGHEPALCLVIGRVPRSMPSAFWRSLRWLRFILRVTTVCMAIWAALLLAALLVGKGLIHRFLEGGGILVIAVLVIVHSAILLYGFRYSVGRFHRFLRSHDLLVCLGCGYILKHLPSVHTCPECGEAYDFEDLRQTWQRWAESNIAYGA